MACQASARMARGWNGSKDWLHKGRTLMVGKKIPLLSFWKCMCFILSTITAVGHPDAKVGPLGTNNTLSSAPSTERGGKRHIRGCLRGGPAVKRLGAPPLSAWLIRRTSEMPDLRRSWAGVLGALGRGSVLLNVRALYPADPQDVGAQGWLALA